MTPADSLGAAAVWPGVDFVAEAQDGDLKWSLVVQPGAEDRLNWTVAGAVPSAGDPTCLVLDASGAAVYDRGLVAEDLETGLPVVAEWVVTGQTVSVRLGGHVGPVLVDPVVSAVFATSNTANDDEARAVAVAADGSAWVGGTYNDGVTTECYISHVVGSTVTDVVTFGGSGSDSLEELLILANGTIAAAGWTSSGDFPTTTGSYDEVLGGGEDGWFATFTQSGGQLFCSYIGGFLADRATGMADFGDGTLLLVGTCSLTGFPVTAGAYDTSANGGKEAWVARVGGTGLVWATYWGYPGDDVAYSCDVDQDGMPWVVGMRVRYWTAPYDDDGFVISLSADGKNLLASRIIAGTDDDRVTDVEVVGSGDDRLVIVVGKTLTSNIACSFFAIDPSYNGGQDAFFAAFPPDLTTQSYMTYIGGSGQEGGGMSEEVRDPCLAYSETGNDPTVSGSALIAFRTASTGLYSYAGGSSLSGSSDAYFLQLLHEQDGIWSQKSAGYFGGSSDEAVRGVSASGGVTWRSGQTTSSDFPASGSYGGGADSWAIRWDYRDLTAPLVSISELNSTLTWDLNDSYLVVWANASDAHDESSGLSGLSATVAGHTKDMSQDSNAWTCSFSDISLSPGSHPLVVTAEDGEGNEGTATAVVQVGNVPDIRSVRYNETAEELTVAEVIVRASDSRPGDSGLASVEVLSGGKSYDPSVEGGSLFTFRLPVPGANMTLSFRVRATDESGYVNTTRSFDILAVAAVEAEEGTEGQDDTGGGSTAGPDASWYAFVAVVAFLTVVVGAAEKYLGRYSMVAAAILVGAGLGGMLYSEVWLWWQLAVTWAAVAAWAVLTAYARPGGLGVGAALAFGVLTAYAFAMEAPVVLVLASSLGTVAGVAYAVVPDTKVPYVRAPARYVSAATFALLSAYFFTLV